MNTEKNCHFCTLFLCDSNLYLIEDMQKIYHRKCIIEIIGSRRPIECECHCKVRNNSREREEKYEKFMHEFQTAEGNLPCFHLGGGRCNKRGS